MFALVSTLFCLCLGVNLAAGLSLRPGSKFSIQHTKAVDAVASRRQALAWAAAGVATTFVSSTAAMADTGAEVRGIQVTPLNGLIFNYRGTENPDTSVKAEELNEPSIAYADFVAKLKTGDVEFVEFLAPDGDVAYATMKGEGKPIRIGEGYPKEQHDGWSSPAFAVRAVKNAGVPYKFTVPALSSYRSG